MLLFAHPSGFRLLEPDLGELLALLGQSQVRSGMRQGAVFALRDSSCPGRVGEQKNRMQNRFQSLAAWADVLTGGQSNDRFTGSDHEGVLGKSACRTVGAGGAGLLHEGAA